MAAAETIEINDIFELAFRFVTETNENIFLTGKAGTGKTTFLKYLRDHCSKNIIVAAPTGVAAINAGGVTLHSLFQLPFHPFIPTAGHKNEMLQKLRFTRRRLDLIRKMDLLVIDEVSMVRCDTMDAIDTILRHVRRKHDLPFGGVQLLFIGDLYQLPPVAPQRDWVLLKDYYDTEFFFDSHVIRESMPVLIELNKIFRQKEDAFICILNKVRNNEMQQDDFNELHARYQPGFTPDKSEKYITLTTHNGQADAINQAALTRLGGKPFVYRAEIRGDFPESMYPVDESLGLKMGAQVMFLKNDVEKKYFNGKIGIIKDLDNEQIIVDCDGEKINVKAETWDNTRYTLKRDDGKLEQEVLGTFSQYPLRLAWAITIHKSQGLTFDKVMIDAGSAFSSGQVYVALSRCRSLNGIVLLSKISSSAILSNESVIKCHQTMTPRISLAERFQGARQVYTQQLFDEIFSFEDIRQAISRLSNQLHGNAEKINQEAAGWLQQLLADFKNIHDVGHRFLSLVAGLMQKEGTVEKNLELRQRISAAAGHFSPLLIVLKDKIHHHPVVTEHREAATPLDEALTEILHLLLHEIYIMEFCKGQFGVTDFLKHKLKYTLPKVSLTTYASNKKQSFSDVVNPELFDTLKRWRDIICQDLDLPIYMVANQASIKAIAEYLPLSPRDLMKVPGFGKAKVEKFGDDILDIVKDFCDKKNLDTNINALAVNPKKEKKPPKADKMPTKTVTYNLFKEGKSIEEIAAERKMVTATIEGHLAGCIEDGLIRAEDVLPKDVQAQINSVANTHGWESFQVLKTNLPDHISYGQLRMARSAAASREQK